MPTILDPARESLVVNGVHVQLTTTQYRIAGLLAEAKGSVVRVESMIVPVWPDPGRRPRDPLATLRLAVLDARKRLTEQRAGLMIRTHRGVGWSIDLTLPGAR